MLAASTHCFSSTGPRSSLTPRASSTSAEPLLEEAERLPCLTTRTPAAATMIAAAEFEEDVAERGGHRGTGVRASPLARFPDGFDDVLCRQIRVDSRHVQR